MPSGMLDYVRHTDLYTNKTYFGGAECTAVRLLTNPPFSGGFLSYILNF